MFVWREGGKLRERERERERERKMRATLVLMHGVGKTNYTKL
jgi:hypothetical protein